MLESVSSENGMIDAEDSLSYCVDRLMFISDGLEAKDISFKGYSGASILIRDIADELGAIEAELRRSRGYQKAG